MKVWLNGVLDDVENLRISPLDHGLLTGDGVFETLRVYGGTPFAWSRHYARLMDSASGLDLDVPPDEELRDATKAVIEANEILEARLRITITGGEAPLGSERSDARHTVIVAASQVDVPPSTTDVVTAPWARNEKGATSGMKTISYGENVRALAYAHQRGAGEAIFANTRGEVCEATGSNLFLVTDGILHTPPPDSGCLLGVTRALIIELAATHGIELRQEALPLDALKASNEAFLSSTTREVQAISAVDGRDLPMAPGPITELLRESFSALVARDLNP